MIRYSDPFLRTLPLRRLLDRMLEDMNYQQDAPQQREPEAQAIPVNIFHTADQLVLVAPMPGASPDDIEVSVAGDTVTLRSEFRGPHQEEKNYVLREWSYGPYERTIQLPCGVDAERTNASFNNGVLVLNLPKRDVTRPHRVTLHGQNAARGVQQARSGHDTLKDPGESSQDAKRSDGERATAMAGQAVSPGSDGGSRSGPAPGPRAGGQSSGSTPSKGRKKS